MEAPLTILYTANIRGDLALLPRLYTFIRQLMHNPKQTILVDLGASCTRDVWHCAATQGRSTLIALDGMGYAAAHVADVLTQSSRDKLAEQVFMGLVDAGLTHTKNDVVLASCHADVPDHAQWAVILTPAEQTRLDGNVLSLASVDKGQVGQVRLQGDVMDYQIHTLPENTRLDPTIQGAVDFIISEAKYYENRH